MPPVGAMVTITLRFDMAGFLESFVERAIIFGAGSALSHRDDIRGQGLRGVQRLQSPLSFAFIHNKERS
jgi:hypothetical protein